MPDQSTTRHFQLCSGILLRGEQVLLVRCRYEEEVEALWTLPGGRQDAGESIEQTVVREFLEETSLPVKIRELAYVSESFDSARERHVINCTFFVQEMELGLAPRPADRNVLEARFVPLAETPALLAADVLRIPVAAALSGALGRRYFAFREADIRVPFFGRRTTPHV